MFRTLIRKILLLAPYAKHRSREINPYSDSFFCPAREVHWWVDSGRRRWLRLSNYIGSYRYNKKITSYLLDGCIPRRRETGGGGRRQDERQWTCDLGTARREATRVSTRRDVKKYSLVTKVLADHPTLQTEPWRHFWTLRNLMSTALLKTVLNTTRKYTERQQNIHKP